jgi:polyisoprenoid-binding protein YceI
MRHRHFLLVPALVLVAFWAMSPFNAQAEAVRYEILPGSEVVFESKAPMEKFKGTTKEVSGWFEADLANLDGPVALEVRVELASFDTGKKKRNKHMRENHLETDKYPQAVFRAGGAGSVRSEDGKTIVALKGEMDLHGVSKEVTYEIVLDYRADGTVVVETEFIVKLSEHDIDRPRFLVMKLADEQKVSVKLKARSQAGEGGND